MDLFDEELLSLAAHEGELPYLKWAAKHGCPVDLFVESGAVWIAAERGNLPMLLFLAQHGVPADDAAVEAAATNGHLDCLYHLLEMNCAASASAVRGAARNNHLGCLRLLHTHGSPWDATAYCALDGELHVRCEECLHYLLCYGCPCSDDRRRMAARIVARNLLWPRLRCASRVVSLLRYWRFRVVAEGRTHGTAAASLSRSLEMLAADETIATLVTVCAPRLPVSS